MSVEQVGIRKWRVRVQYRDPRTGRSRSFERTVEGARRDALGVESQLRAQAKRGAERKQRLKLSAYASSWIASRVGAVRPSVAKKYATSLDLHVLPALGDYYLDALTPADVQTYVVERSKRAAGNTVLNELRLIRTTARDSVAAGYAERNWADRVKPPPVLG